MHLNIDHTSKVIFWSCHQWNPIASFDPYSILHHFLYLYRHQIEVNRFHLRQQWMSSYWIDTVCWLTNSFQSKAPYCFHWKTRVLVETFPFLRHPQWQMYCLLCHQQHCYHFQSKQQLRFLLENDTFLLSPIGHVWPFDQSIHWIHHRHDWFEH